MGGLKQALRSFCPYLIALNSVNYSYQLGEEMKDPFFSDSCLFLLAYGESMR